MGENILPHTSLVNAKSAIEIPSLYIVIPCYNEQQVLPETHKLFLSQLEWMIFGKKVSEDSRIVFVNDGSRDETWNLILAYTRQYALIEGISLSRNRGHQNALLAGLMAVKEVADIAISIDCDGQDDIRVMEAMVDEYLNGSDIVYGVRSKRTTDTFFKRFTAECFYRLMKCFGADVVFNHADYRLLSQRALEGLSQFQEVNLFLRGIIPLVGYRYSCVCYERKERIAGDSHYPLRRMLSFAIDGITSLSIRPIRMITGLGFLISFVSLLGVFWALFRKLTGGTISGWTSLVCAIFMLGGIQILAVGIIGEYVGKIYLEAKHRPRYLLEENTLTDKEKRTVE